MTHLTTNDYDKSRVDCAVCDIADCDPYQHMHPERKASRKTSTRVLAQRVMREVKQRFAAYIEPGHGPVLVKDYEGWYGSSTPYAIVWEGGPFEWTQLASLGGVDEEMTSLMQEFTGPRNSRGTPTTNPLAGKKPEPVMVKEVKVDGAFIEPVNGYVLGVYRADDQ